MTEEETGKRATRPQLAASLLLVASLCLLAFFSYSFIESVSGQQTNDQDEDGMDDLWEQENGLNSSDPTDADLDPDEDDLTNLQEYHNRTDPRRNDTDRDGMSDGWEVNNGLNPLIGDSENDPDGDGLPNLREFEIDSDPNDYYDPPKEPPVDDDDDVVPSDNDSSDEALGAASSMYCIVIVFILIVGTVILLIGMGIYSKIRKDRILDHETRQHIVDYLKKNPGAYYSQMRKELDLAHGVLTHHINMLEQQEVLFSKQDRSYRRFYLDGMHRKGPIVVGKQKEVLDMVRRYPGSSQSEIGRKLGLGRMIVSYHINQLEQLELIFKVKHGRENLIHPSNGDDKVPSAKEDLFLKDPYESGAPEIGAIET
jgi:DNA-binding MarR family transcriptional regulator